MRSSGLGDNDSIEEGDGEEEGEISWARAGIDVEEQFPLAQRQWDTISQFRTQISHKATQSLRIATRTPRVRVLILCWRLES